jgi:hypothetical protein
MMKRFARMLAITSLPFLYACGGGDKAASVPPGPALKDTVLFSSASAGNGAIVTINRAGYIRAFGSGNRQALTVGLGTVPMTGNAASANGNGWLPSASTFVNGTATLNANPGSSSYTLIVAGGNIKASDSTMSTTNLLVKPTLSSLGGTFGITTGTQIVISGNTFSGTYGNNCSWSGTLTPQANTIDVTEIVFGNLIRQFNPSGVACPFTGKTFTGTAFLLGPSAAYAKGTFMLNWDDGGANVPTEIHEMNFPRQ